MKIVPAGAGSRLPAETQLTPLRCLNLQRARQEVLWCRRYQYAVTVRDGAVTSVGKPGLGLVLWGRGMAVPVQDGAAH